MVLMNKTEIANHLKAQFSDMVKRGIIPTIEHELNSGDYLTVNITAHDNGFHFMMSEDLETSFSGEIKTDGDGFTLPYDPYFEDLDHYLQQISDEITEGCLLPNGLI